MDEVIQLMQLLVDGHIDYDTFAGDYITLGREIRDEQWTALETSGLKRESDELGRLVLAGLISKEEFGKRNKALWDQVEGERIKGLSRESEIIAHIFVEADAYESDPQQRTYYQIGEQELLAEVRKALDELKAIHSTKD
ncbi:MAG: hypothetical protein GC179_16755 [Anaerolineaceae bacterium]|nr:hypothetical protein [Anaerolineaceae bacterium]